MLQELQSILVETNMFSELLDAWPPSHSCISTVEFCPYRNTLVRTVCYKALTQRGRQAQVPLEGGGRGTWAVVREM